MRPLFFKELDEAILTVHPEVKDTKGKTLSADALITKLSEANEEDFKSLVDAKDLGFLTFSGHILIETLNRLGMEKFVSLILSSPDMVYRAALFTAIGIKAGLTLPEGIEIETEYRLPDSSPTKLREVEESDKEHQCSGCDCSRVGEKNPCGE